jgi:hypothetical protein
MQILAINVWNMALKTTRKCLQAGVSVLSHSQAHSLWLAQACTTCDEVSKSSITLLITATWTQIGEVFVRLLRTLRLKLLLNLHIKVITRTQATQVNVGDVLSPPDASTAGMMPRFLLIISKVRNSSHSSLSSTANLAQETLIFETKLESLRWHLHWVSKITSCGRWRTSLWCVLNFFAPLELFHKNNVSHT